jgi:hypothetical protein
MVCDRPGLIGRQLCAIDGVTLPGNAAKASSGPRKAFRRAAQQMARAVRSMLARQRHEDLPHPCAPLLRRRQARQVERLQ